MKTWMGMAPALALIAGCGDADEVGRADEPLAGPASFEPQEPATRPIGVATIGVATKDDVGSYLVDRDGRALYVLEGDRTGQKACTGACLGEWPPMWTESAPQAASGVESNRIGTKAQNGKVQVTYAGWPLYYYRADRQPGQISGHDVHDQWGGWYLLSPSGEPIDH